MANLTIGNKKTSSTDYSLLLDANLKIKDYWAQEPTEVNLVSDSIPATGSTISDIQHF